LKEIVKAIAGGMKLSIQFQHIKRRLMAGLHSPQYRQFGHWPVSGAQVTAGSCLLWRHV